MNSIVIKIGTNVLTNSQQALDITSLNCLVTQLAICLNTTSSHYTIVTSGAITCGANKLKNTPQTIPEKQAAAAIGQVILMNEYKQAFQTHDLITAQLLLSKEGLTREEGQQNFINTINTLHDQNIIPIINENDTIATSEIQFGDNDQLSAQIATLINADQLIILTDIDGIHTDNPKLTPDAKKIDLIDNIDSPKLDALINDIYSQTSKGGMKSKLAAAKNAALAGIKVVIANGRHPNVITNIINELPEGTMIHPKGENP